ncbi:MAG: DMT family transporter [Bacteroidales bacterium]|jgi:drug/metabolite transporter (DMT)-like permease|nr:DMT family transporter [Bacteroidales bacterium]
MNRSRLSYIYAGTAILFWATIPTAFKICLGEMSVLHMLSIASVTSALALLGILLLEKKTSLLRLSSPSDLLKSAILGLMNPFIYYLVLLRAYQLLPAQVAQPLNMIWPIILVFLSVPILKQKIAARSFIALFISFIGVYIISSQGHLFSHNQANTKGVLLATGSSVFWALYFILNMKDKRDEAVKLFLNFLFGSFYLALTLAITGNWPVSISLRGLSSAVYIGLFEMGITFFFWLKALQMAPSTDKVSNLVYLAPFLSLVFVHFILHEPIYYTTPAGLILIVSGILVQNKKRKSA